MATFFYFCNFCQTVYQHIEFRRPIDGNFLFSPNFRINWERCTYRHTEYKLYYWVKALLQHSLDLLQQQKWTTPGKMNKTTMLGYVIIDFNNTPPLRWIRLHTSKLSHFRDRTYLINLLHNEKQFRVTSMRPGIKRGQRDAG